MNNSIVTSRGVYKDLTHTPYTVKAYGKIYRFSSQKKKSMFLKRLQTNNLKVKYLFEDIELITGVLYEPDTVLQDTCENTYKLMEHK